MSFIRPEAAAALRRWREVMAGLALAALGLWWALGSPGILGWIGWALLPAGLALAFVGLRRALFAGDGQGLGVVQVTEGQIAYFGPFSGGAVAITELERLTLDPTDAPPAWVLDQPGQPGLHIPLNAKGAEALFDVFAALPGLDSGRLLAQMRGRPVLPVVVWERRSERPVQYRLH